MNEQNPSAIETSDQRLAGRIQVGMAGLGVMGAVCGATGGAITGAALASLSRVPVLPQDGGEAEAKETRLVRVAGAVCGLLSAALCNYLAPLGFIMDVLRGKEGQRR